MFRKITLVSAMLCFFISVRAQVFTDSNLPIVIISTYNNAAIPDEPGIAAAMKIVYRGAGLRTYLVDQYNAAFVNYSGNVDIELRGSYSQTLPKKGYGFSTKKADLLTDDNVPLLGMPAENDWVLNCLNYDPSLIRDYLAYNLSRGMGRYASRTAFCEVVVNGDYKGLYLLQEKIKPDKNRVNIEKIMQSDNTLPELSGGYITKTDKPTGGDPIAWYMSSYIGNNDNIFIHSWPHPEQVSIPQNNYIRSVFQNLQQACSSNNASKSNGYPSLIDIPSFVDFMLLNELSGNTDAYTFSTYYSKDRGGKLNAGPVWDLNLTFGNDLFALGFDRSKPYVWQFSNGNNEGPRYFRDLYNSSIFRCYMSKRWNELIQPGQAFHSDNIENLIDNAVTQIKEAVIREDTRWNTIGMHQDTIKAMKSWLKQRIPWMTSRLGSFSACQNVSTPPLVISRINYHPKANVDFPDEDKLEFIEISNTGIATVDLTGIYFGGTDLVYQFPPGSSLPGGKAIILASNPSSFKRKYDVTPFGQFSRNLSNADYKLVMSDAFGNEIDIVHYYDKQPWPNADGNGRFLQLIDKSLDNALASSWIAVEENTVSTENAIDQQAFHFFPNPATSLLNFATSEKGVVEILNFAGQVVEKQQLEEGKNAIDVSALSNGIYLIRFQNGKGISVRSFMIE